VDAAAHHLDEKQLKRMWMKQNLAEMQVDAEAPHLDERNTKLA